MKLLSELEDTVTGLENKGAAELAQAKDDAEELIARIRTSFAMRCLACGAAGLLIGLVAGRLL